MRQNPGIEPWKEGRGISNTILPAVKDGSVAEEFRAFSPKNWRYPCKNAAPSSGALESDAFTTQSGPSSTAHQSTFPPGIMNWVSGIPALGDIAPAQRLPANNSVGGQAFHSHQYPSQAPYTEQMKARPEQQPHISQPKDIDHHFTPNEVESTTGIDSKLTQNQSGVTSESGLAAAAQSGTSHGQLVDISGADDSIAEETEQVSESPMVSTADNIFAQPALESPQPPEHDPFAHLWRECVESTAGIVLRDTEDRSIEADSLISLSDEGEKPRLAQSNEKDDRSFYSTMKQKAGTRPIPSRIFPEYDLNMMTSINKSLASLMAPLTMWSGFIDFRIDLGRFCFTNIRKLRVQEPDDNDNEKYFRMDRIHNELNKRHTSGDSLLFTRVLTSLGADANHMAYMRDSDGNQMWKRPGDGRSSIYEFTCRSTTEAGVEHHFVVEIDATRFTSSVKAFKPDQNCFAVNCTKRVWDFQIVLSISQDLNDAYGCFAEDLVRSLRVM